MLLQAMHTNSKAGSITVSHCNSQGNDLWLQRCNTQEHICCCEGKNLRNKLATAPRTTCHTLGLGLKIQHAGMNLEQSKLQFWWGISRKSADPAKARKQMGSEQATQRLCMTSHKSLFGDVQVFQLSFHLCSCTGGVVSATD